VVPSPWPNDGPITLASDNRGDFGTGDWFLVGAGEYEFRLNNVGIAIRAEASRRREDTDHYGE
jgi:hypothetical protein